MIINQPMDPHRTSAEMWLQAIAELAPDHQLLHFDWKPFVGLSWGRMVQLTLQRLDKVTRVTTDDLDDYRVDVEAPGIAIAATVKRSRYARHDGYFAVEWLDARELLKAILDIERRATS